MPIHFIQIETGENFELLCDFGGSARAAFRYGTRGPHYRYGDYGFRVGMTAPTVGITEALNEDEDTEE